jgi:hypothetical protein
MDRAARDGVTFDADTPLERRLSRLFERYRFEIELSAGTKYESGFRGAGDDDVVVMNVDLNP